jgi:hypothetical protein
MSKREEAQADVFWQSLLREHLGCLREHLATDNTLNAAQAQAKLRAARKRLVQLEAALRDATAHLAGAASAYRKHAARHRSVGRAVADPFFTTRVADFERATERARVALSN